ncbi:MAG: hypothetical protein MJ223_03675 [Mycoplasmoidaceae bacterium]|nr:hypothetical protein [Mycoplasmoidaceae bacterium]
MSVAEANICNHCSLIIIADIDAAATMKTNNNPKARENTFFLLNSFISSFLL